MSRTYCIFLFAAMLTAPPQAAAAGIMSESTSSSSLRGVEAAGRSTPTPTSSITSSEANAHAKADSDREAFNAIKEALAQCVVSQATLTHRLEVAETHMLNSPCATCVKKNQADCKACAKCQMDEFVQTNNAIDAANHC